MQLPEPVADLACQPCACGGVADLDPDPDL